MNGQKVAIPYITPANAVAVGNILYNDYGISLYHQSYNMKSMDMRITDHFDIYVLNLETKDKPLYHCFYKDAPIE
jgi:ABC-type polysaccharide transport system permease subunit